jgi:hypothetical protein
VKATPELTRGGVLLVDDSAEEKAGEASAGSHTITKSKFKKQRLENKGPTGPTWGQCDIVKLGMTK